MRSDEELRNTIDTIVVSASNNTKSHMHIAAQGEPGAPIYPLCPTSGKDWRVKTPRMYPGGTWCKKCVFQYLTGRIPNRDDLAGIEGDQYKA